MNLALWCARMTGYSGVECYTRDLALALAGRGHQVRVHADGWAVHMRDPLERAGVQPVDPGMRGGNVDFSISPKFLPMIWANELGAPCVQVIHSENAASDVPRPHALLRGVVMIRESQSFLLGEPWLKDMPRAVIRNPIAALDKAPPLRHHAPPLAGVLVSEFDEMKCQLAADFAEKIHGMVEMVGPWRCLKDSPPNCRQRGETNDPLEWYANARFACSYRLSRCLPEALHAGCPVWVRGGLEPTRPTCEDPAGDWTLVRPGEFDVAPFKLGSVAAAWESFLGKLA